MTETQKLSQRQIEQRVHASKLAIRARKQKQLKRLEGVIERLKADLNVR
jgi:hypothetical protein